MTASIPEMRLRVYEVLALFELALADDDLERADQWAVLALSVNDADAGAERADA